MEFRERLVGTLRLLRPLFDIPGVLVVGSEVPNLLEPGAAATLIVSQDVDIGVPLDVHGRLKDALAGIQGLRPSREEPSVWLPEDKELLEVNFLGIDLSIQNVDESRLVDDPELPLMVFGPLSLLRPGGRVDVGGVSAPVPALPGLLLEKLVTERSGAKGDRDLLVALGLLLLARKEELAETCRLFRTLTAEARHSIRSNLTVLSLMDAIPGMPDPQPHRRFIVDLLRALEGEDQGGKP
ncbi:MAG: hypothetical protein AB1640_15730 [bacterium]